MRRREFIAGLGGAAAWPVGARGQQAAMLRVGSCSLPPAGPSGRGFLGPFAVRMNELGYVEGQNLTLDYIDLQGRADRYGAAMQELVARQADLLIAFGPEESLKAAMAATKTVPIVMAAIDYDPFAHGYVSSLARPTGNVTGIFLEQIELAAKRLQLAKDAFPAIGKPRCSGMRYRRTSGALHETTRRSSASISPASSCETYPMTTQER